MKKARALREGVMAKIKQLLPTKLDINHSPPWAPYSTVYGNTRALCWTWCYGNRHSHLPRDPCIVQWSHRSKNCPNTFICPGTPSLSAALSVSPAPGKPTAGATGTWPFTIWLVFLGSKSKSQKQIPHLWWHKKSSGLLKQGFTLEGLESNYPGVKHYISTYCCVTLNKSLSPSGPQCLHL
jgi:hypothetical protein